jgi:hypothetical protein
MKIRELIPRLQAMDPEGGVFVVVVKPMASMNSSTSRRFVTSTATPSSKCTNS